MKSLDYRYECGLDNVILKGLPVMQADDGEEVVRIPNIGLLHRVLAVAVASKESGLDGKELRFLRTELGLTQAEMAALVGKEVQAIGRWERGENPIDSAAETVIRVRALQQATADLPPIEDLARRSIQSAHQGPFVIDASDPDDYKPLPIAA